MRKFGLYKSPRPIVLLTDFGFRDSYVGVMKGVILGICPDARVIDLSHNIMPQDVAEAAFVLSSAYTYFAEETVFVCVVDPGVGSQRKVLCMCANDQVFLAPDNGVLSLVAEEKEPEGIYEVTNSEYFLPSVSRTFHGRDIFAPVAAHIASGVPPSEMGPPVRRVHKLRLPRPLRTAEGKLRGKVIYIDQFGNLITNIGEHTLRTTFRCPAEQIEVAVKQKRIQGISGSYSDGKRGELLALIGSSGYLEIAANRDSAEKLLGCERGDGVHLSAAEPAV